MLILIIIILFFLKNKTFYFSLNHRVKNKYNFIISSVKILIILALINEIKKQK
jgi:hypothetical protein